MYGSFRCVMGYVQWDMEADAALEITNLHKEHKTQLIKMINGISMSVMGYVQWHMKNWGCNGYHKSI